MAERRPAQEQNGHKGFWPGTKAAKNVRAGLYASIFGNREPVARIGHPLLQATDELLAFGPVAV